MGFLSLPTELRLHILDYVYDQGPHAGFTLSVVPIKENRGSHRTFTGLILDCKYSPAAILNVRLACRCLRDESTRMAFQRTAFVVRGHYELSATRLRSLQHSQLLNLRNLILVLEPYRLGLITSWRYPFNTANLRLDALTITFTPTSSHDPSTPDDFAVHNTVEIVGLLRRLENVKCLSFVQNATFPQKSFQTWYHKLVGLLLKEDHYQRYDAPGAPHIEATWWDWNYNSDEKLFEFVARPAKPIFPEPEYMEGVAAPLVGRLMSEMEAAL
ncbi:hypothetical protein BU23DRAFT_480335 [Bimuria novae-zelandiae CBS 107.79]|uniref:Uncharacterized protein n=1 Tax=Bimuria novae-zelandiae CBS 107.79 TaxID=1447943 RepID=A0A6A5UWW3_9PLEO|nr:hypothetical protein BU23DRAFT_480335 [Bimuria novae-zelandiae CBS 107.79]